MGNHKCLTCKGTGVLPLRRKSDDKVVPNVWVYCPDCYPPHEQDIPDPLVSDFDFPCSATWRTFYNGDRQIKRNLQASTPSSAPPIGTLNDRRWASVQQLRAQVQWLSKKVTEKRVEKEKRDDNYEPF